MKAIGQTSAIQWVRTLCLLACLAVAFATLDSGSQAATGSKRRARGVARHLSQSARAKLAHRPISAATPEINNQQEVVPVVPFVTTGSAAGFAERPRDSQPEEGQAEGAIIARTARGSVPRQEKQEVMERQEVASVVVDPSLISLLNDLLRTVEDSGGVKSVKDNGSKEVLALAAQILAKALEQPKLSPDRIIGLAGENHESSAKLTCQNWASG